LAKKLKKKIEQICGLDDLDWEARQRRATQILASTEWKQRLCNELIGLSFRELEQTLSGVASERQKKEDNYDKKLKIYEENKRKSKPVRGDTSGDRNQQIKADRKPPRTLDQILAQVYAPREDTTSFRGEEDGLMEFYRRNGLLRNNELLSDSNDGDDQL
jgi:hypothetical protein